MSWLATGAAAVSAVSSLMGSADEKKALKKQQEARIAAFKSQENKDKFSIHNNIQRDNEISVQQAGETAAIGRKIVTEERKAIGKETIRRGEGITAGRSVERSVDDVIAKGNEAKGELSKKSTDAFMAVQGAARDSNAREVAKLNIGYENMVAGVAADQAQMKSGLEVGLGAFSAGMSGAASGASMTKSLKGTGVGAYLGIK